MVAKFEKNFFTLIDVGAAGGIHSRWKKFKNIRIVGFEPDEREFSKLNSSDSQLWFNIALFNKAGEFKLNITKAQTNTSLLIPNFKELKNLHYLNDDFQILKSIYIKCDTLDSICTRNLLRPDIIKLDTQGSELYILQGAEKTLSDSIFAVEAEVEFYSLYENQPLFADVDFFLRDNGFQLMDLGNFLHVKSKNTRGIGGPKSNLISADALYFKKLERLVSDIEEGKEINFEGYMAICIAYGYPDYALEVCYRFREFKKFENIANQYIKELTKISPLKRLINSLPDRGSRFLKRIYYSLIPVKHSHWFVGLGNKF